MVFCAPSKASPALARARPARGVRARSTAPRRSAAVAKVGLLYSTMTGNTENVAAYIQTALGGKVDEAVEIADVGADGLSEYDGFIVGAPTWHTDADENRSGTNWDDELANIAAQDLAGKPCAVFGLGDSAGYSDYFCDAIEEVHSAFKKAGCTMVGKVSADDYEFEASKSVVDGQFLGCPFDEDNESEKSEGRAQAWAKQLETEMAGAF